MHSWLRQSEQAVQRANVRIALAWGLGCALLIALIWAGLLFTIKADRKQMIHVAEAETAGRARTYAEQLLRTLSQIDQLSMSIKYQWERKSDPLDLEEQYRRGVYQGQLFPVLVSADGYSASNTRNLARGTYMGDLPFFAQTRDSDATGLIVSRPTTGRGGFSGKTIVRFTRSLRLPDGRFDGVVLIAVEQDFLVSFHDAASLAPGDFIAARFVDGPLLASRGGTGVAGSFYIRDPSYDGDHGSRIDAGDRFLDSEERVVSWAAIDGYPLVAVAGISMVDVMAPHARTHAIYIALASIASVMLLVLGVFGAWYQIRQSAQRRHDAQVQATFRLAVDGAREAFYMMVPLRDADGKIYDLVIEDCNERAAEMSGYPRGELIGRTINSLYEGQRYEPFFNFFVRVADEGFGEDDFHVPHGRKHAPGWFQRRGVRSGNGIAVTIRDVSEARQQADTLSAMARTDALTGLPNRHWLNDFLPGALARARASGRRLALLYIDLDNFKNVNDSLGHRTGDQLLASVAANLRAALRDQDHLARIGGDEFTVVVEDLDDDADASDVAVRLLAAIAQLGPDAPWRMFRMKGSIGISLFPTDAPDVDTLLRSADVALYEAKTQGKAQYRHYNESFAQKIRDRVSVERELEHAILREEFVIYFQPRADARSGQLSSMEALIRWRHPRRGLLSPADFIGVAEQTRLIVPIGQLVVKQVCRQLSAWRDLGLPLKPVSINVSALQLKTDGLRVTLAESLARYALPPSMVTIELTESSMLDEDGIAQEELERLRQMGIELEIDDFGTGYSSLSKLQSLAIDVLKIDQSFVRKLGSDPQAQALCETMVQIGRSLDIAVVAEGVETAEQLHMLQHMGCDEVQGYLVSKPVPPEKIPPLLGTQFFEPYRLSA